MSDLDKLLPAINLAFLMVPSAERLVFEFSRVGQHEDSQRLDVCVIANYLGSASIVTAQGIKTPDDIYSVMCALAENVNAQVRESNLQKEIVLRGIGVDV